MKIIRLIGIVNFLFVLLLISNTYAEYPTSTPEFIEFPVFDLGNLFNTESSSVTSASGGSAAANSTGSSTITWTGASPENNHASNPENWSGGEVPQNGTDVIFDSLSPDCEWNLTVSIASLTVTSGYTGKITLSSGSNLSIVKTVKWSGGAQDDESASNSANWFGGKAPQDGDYVVFDDATSKNCTWDLDIKPDFLSMIGYTGTITLDKSLEINGNLTINSGTLNLNNKNLDVEGHLRIGNNGALNAASFPIVTITLKGDWINYGNFTCGLSTVILAGGDQTIYGSTTFYNLIKTVTSAYTLYFEAGETQTVLGVLILQGASDNLLSLRSTEEASWNLNLQGAHSFSFTDIEYLNNTSSTTIIARNSRDSGNNSNVTFGGALCVCREDGRRTC